MIDPTRFLRPLAPDEEVIIEKIASELLAKPGFARTEATKDYLKRALRKAATLVGELRQGKTN